MRLLNRDAITHVCPKIRYILTRDIRVAPHDPVLVLREHWCLYCAAASAVAAASALRLHFVRGVCGQKEDKDEEDHTGKTMTGRKFRGDSLFFESGL